MAILYTLDKIKDDFILNVSQDTDIKVTFISDNSNEVIDTKEILADNTYTLPIVKDGHYKLTLNAEGETESAKEFYSLKKLQQSIINDAKVLLCDDCDCGCNDKYNSKCLSEAAKRCLQYKGIFVKLLSYQNLYVHTYSAKTPLTFITFLIESTKVFECKVQTLVNTLLMEECIYGDVKNTEKLFKLYLALYWAGMYFIEKSFAFEDEEELAFIKDKYSYDTIIGCLCNTCIDMNTLEDIFDESSSTIELTTIYSFQYDNPAYDISNIDLLTEAYLTANGNIETIESLEAGKEISYITAGRVGFVIKDTFPNKYIIRDVLGNDITNTFDISYDTVTLTEYYVSPDIVTPSNIYYKFENS